MKNHLLLLAYALVTQGLFAQDATNLRPKLEYGILTDFHLSYLKLNSDITLTGPNGEVEEIDVNTRPGFSLGIFGRYNLTERLAIVPQALITFHSSEIFFEPEGNNGFREEVQPVILDFPIHFVMTGVRHERINPSILIGGRYRLALPTTEDDSNLDLNRHDFAIDLGTGLEIKTKHFYVKPELIYSFGLGTLTKSDGTDLVNVALEDLSRDQIALRVAFYGSK